MGGSPSQQWAEEFEKQAIAREAQAYSIGIPALQNQYQAIGAMQGMGGEPLALQQAYGGARAGLADAAALASRDALQRQLQGNAPAAAGGNIGASLATPADMGTGIARALYGSRITEATGALEEQQKLFGEALGQAQTAGSGMTSAMGAQLGAIPTMQQYNTSYANVLGALNLGASLYGAGQQAGWFGGGNTGLLAGLGAGQTNPASIPFGGGSFAGTVGDMSSVG